METMEPIFVKYRLKALMVDPCTKHILYNYDPPYPDSHAMPFDCMVKNQHVYVLNYDLKSLEQKNNGEGDKQRSCAYEGFCIGKKSAVVEQQVMRQAMLMIIITACMCALIVKICHTVE